MISLCIDTAYRYLTVALIKDDAILSSVSRECFKRQSEEVFLALDELFKTANIDKRSLDAICISKGPGSYTGVRIAMTIAKVYAKIADIDLYTISTLKLYAGNQEKTMVLMDARAHRAYVGVYDKGVCLLKDSALNLDDIDMSDYNVILDASLLGKEDVLPDIPSCFLATKADWEKADEINFVVPEYLKESENYSR